MNVFPPHDPVAAALNAKFGPEFGAAFRGEEAFSLEPLRVVLAALGDPQNRLPPVIHIAGTNGKGSTAAFAQAILKAAGLRVHAFTQPHLLRTTERIALANAPIQEEAFLALINRLAALGAPLSHFEAQTACAFLAFAETPGDAVVLEVGVGGLFDATNVIPAPVVCLITTIGEDHKQALGGSLPAIARHKAGIIKPGAAVFTAPQEDPAVDRVFEAQAMRAKAPLSMGGVDWTVRREDGRLLIETRDELIDLPLPSLPGDHQLINAGLAALGAQELFPGRVQASALAEGVSTATWPGRLQRINRGPLAALARAHGHRLVADGGHNPAAAQALAAWIAQQPDRVSLIVGMLADKDPEAFLAPLVQAGASVIVAVEPKGSRPPLAAQTLGAAARRVGAPQTGKAKTLQHAITTATEAADAAGVVLITGSLALVAEALYTTETEA